MAVRSIVVGLALRGQPDDPARDYALSMGSVLDARVTGVAYAVDPPISFSIMPEFTADLFERQRADTRKKTEAAQSAFLQAAGRTGVAHECHVERGSLEQSADRFAQRLRTADLAVLTQHDAADLAHVGDIFLEAALLQSGRPVVIVPRGQRSEFSTGRVLIAWDGSLSAARALGGALPLLSASSRVDVLSLREESKGSDLGASAVVDYLRLHEIKAEPMSREVLNIPEAILEFAEASTASLVVMGGYGKSRLREFIFGGATQLMLSKMKTPVLMAH